ncbi:hypothetical protein [Bacillus velezensis]|uniref:hypothetical protein n=1 Tax=Bacillus velezensis TaxID=492670 RepID=UPI00288A43DC|nr:hypothetical protein [Bacillus velezensis]WNJ14011.1 hypothetical protein RJY17_01660 [Bacillus velezensis]
MNTNNSVVIGTVKLTVSRPTAIHKNQNLAILESYYAISDDRVKMNELVLKNKKGNVMDIVKVHKLEIDWICLRSCEK